MGKFSIIAFITSVVIVGVYVFAQNLRGADVYEISELNGHQVYYASHIKPEGMKDPREIDNEDRAALLGAIGKPGISMPRLKTPIVNFEAKMQPSKLYITSTKADDGRVKSEGRLEYRGGQDNYMVIDEVDTLTCVLMAEGVMQVYTIHRNVTFPDGEKLVTCITTRNRPLGVSTLCASGKAKLVR